MVAGQISRFAAPYARMRQSLLAGRVGGLCALRLRRDFSRDWFLTFGDRVHPVWESCIHDIDLAVSFVRRPVQRVTAVQSEAAGDAAASVVSALLEFEGGVVATVESAWLVPGSAPRTLAGALALDGSIVAEAEVLGLEGVLRQRLVADNLVEWTNDGAFVPDLSLWPEEDGVVGGALRHEVDYAIGCCRPPPGRSGPAARGVLGGRGSGGRRGLAGDAGAGHHRPARLATTRAFGGPVSAPTFDRLADQGLRYTRRRSRSRRSGRRGRSVPPAAAAAVRSVGTMCPGPSRRTSPAPWGLARDRQHLPQ